jgi:hypothetical protein
VLYHGTSRARLLSILHDGVIRVAPTGVRCVSLTDSFDVARYFAGIAAQCDLDEGRGDGEAVIVFIAADRVDAQPFSDPVWGDGECDWERERAVWSDVPADVIVGWQRVEAPA